MMKRANKVRWMLNFWHSDGTRLNEADFPDVDFWQPNMKTSMAEAVRVLAELREDRGDERDWIAAGHPDPWEVASGAHFGGSWVLRYEDLVCAADSSQGETDVDKHFSRLGLGGEKGRSAVDWDKMKRELHEARHAGSRR